MPAPHLSLGHNSFLNDFEPRSTKFLENAIFVAGITRNLTPIIAQIECRFP
jgi:hypothetical protein